MNKPRIIKDYDKLPIEVKEQIKIVYPMGYSKHLVTFMSKDGEKKQGLPFETEDYVYLIRMTTSKAQEIIDNDEDFDDDGNLKVKAKKKYEEKYEDEDFLDELNANDDNDLGLVAVDDLDLDDDDD